MKNLDQHRSSFSTRRAYAPARGLAVHLDNLLCLVTVMNQCGLRSGRCQAISSSRWRTISVTILDNLWSAKLLLVSLHFRWCEALELSVDLIQIKGLWIELASHPFQHLLMLRVLRILYSLQKARVPPDATAILGRTGAFAREAHRVGLPRFAGEHLFDKQVVIPAITKVILI